MTAHFPKPGNPYDLLCLGLPIPPFLIYVSILLFLQYFRPISGAIYWSNDIEKNLSQTLNSLSAVSHVTEHKTWPTALEKYEAFRMELHKYKMRRYDEWRSRVSDILDANLTRQKPYISQIEPSIGHL